MFMSITNRRLADIEQLLWDIMEKLDQEKVRDMATKEELLAKVAAETDAITALTAAADVMNENHASVEEALQALKDKVGSGGEADFSDLDAALGNLSSATAGLKKALVKGVPEFSPSDQ